jgi:hypothetical protein
MGIEIDSNEIIKSLEEVNEHYKVNRKKVESLLEEQRKLFKETVDSLTPAIQWINKNGYVFTHPTIKYQSGRGPIVGYDSKENLLFILNTDNKTVTEVDLYSKEESTLPYWKFIEGYSFEDAMDGLLYVKKMINEYNNEIQKSISILQAQLKKYQD